MDTCPSACASATMSPDARDDDDDDDDEDPIGCAPMPFEKMF